MKEIYSGQDISGEMRQPRSSLWSQKMKRIHFILLGLFGNDLNFVSAELYSNFSNVQSFLDSIQASNTIELVGLINRIRGGPDNLAWLDCILLGAVVIAGMELINYLVKTIGSKYPRIMDF